MNLLRDERGQTMMVVALCIASLCGMAGFAVDVGTLFRAKRNLQTAADAAAVSGADESKYGDWKAAAKAAAAQNGIVDGSGGATVTCQQPTGVRIARERR